MAKLKYALNTSKDEPVYGEIFLFERPEIVESRMIDALINSRLAKFILSPNGTTTMSINPKAFLFWEVELL